MAPRPLPRPHPRRIRRQWNRQPERVDAVSAPPLRQADSSRNPAAPARTPKPPPNSSPPAAIEAGIEHFVDQEALEYFLGRMEFAGIRPARHHPRSQRLLPRPPQLRRPREAQPTTSSSWNEASTPDSSTNRPSHPSPHNGRQTKIHYEQDKTAVDFLPAAGLLRHEGHAADRPRQDAPSSSICSRPIIAPCRRPPISPDSGNASTRRFGAS